MTSIDRISTSGQAMTLLNQLNEQPPLTRDNVGDYADKLAALVMAFPAAFEAIDVAEAMRKLTDRVYAMKRWLPKEKQTRIGQLFRKLHHLSPKRVDELISDALPAKHLVTDYKDEDAVICGRQAYPVPLSLLADEEAVCSTYFMPLTVYLNDASSVSISRGLLARFSDMVKAMQAKDEPPDQQVLNLDQVDRDQFDTLIAFLETGAEELINEENMMSLLAVANYLKISKVMESCQKAIALSLEVESANDDEKIVALLNTLNPKSQFETILDLEFRVSNMFKEAICEDQKAPAFLEKIAYYRDHLLFPIDLSLSSTPVTDETLALFKDVSVSALRIAECPNLTVSCLATVADMPKLELLDVGYNGWVDDSLLLVIPGNITMLMLSGCAHITGEGLRDLEKTNVHSLNLSGCRQLAERDFSAIPDIFETLDCQRCRGMDLASMQALGKLTKLRNLTLSTLDEAQAKALPKGLVKLHIVNSNVSQDIISELEAAGITVYLPEPIQSLIIS